MAKMYRTTNFISAAWIFFPRNSGVRPTISPAMNTARMALMSRPTSPTPVPPGDTSPSFMLTRGTMPPRGVKLSWAALTAPVEVPVVDAANRPDAAGPKRISLPSTLPPA